MKFLDAEFVQGFIRMANDGWEQGRNLVRHILRRMIMSVVHERHAAFMLCGETQRKFCRTHGVGLHADTEYLGFHARLDKLPVIRLR